MLIWRSIFDSQVGGQGSWNHGKSLQFGKLYQDLENF